MKKNEIEDLMKIIGFDKIGIEQLTNELKENKKIVINVAITGKIFTRFDTFVVNEIDKDNYNIEKTYYRNILVGSDMSGTDWVKIK